MDPQALLREHLPLIDRAAAFTCRRNHLSREDSEDFVQWLKLRLIEDDYAVFRRFRGESKIETYLTKVVLRRFQDYRNHLWGKYRPTTRAKDLGSAAVELECLIVRDGMTVDEAVEHMVRRGVGSTREELEALAARLPCRFPRREVDDVTLADFGVDGGNERRVDDGERAALFQRVRIVLEDALAQLPADDQLLIRLCYEEDMKLARVAAARQVKLRALYTHRDRCLRHLRGAFDAAGLSWDRVRDLLGWEGLEFSLAGPEAGISHAGPSEDAGRGNHE